MVGACAGLASQRHWPGGDCRQHGLSLASFGYWRGKLAGEAQPVSPAVPPIQVAAHDPHVEVVLPCGIVLRVAAVDPRWLADLLRVLGAC